MLKQQNKIFTDVHNLLFKFTVWKNVYIIVFSSLRASRREVALVKVFRASTYFGLLVSSQRFFRFKGYILVLGQVFWNEEGVGEMRSVANSGSSHDKFYLYYNNIMRCAKLW